MQLTWVPVACTVALSLGAIAAMLDAAATISRRPGGITRSLTESRSASPGSVPVPAPVPAAPGVGALPACPRINYGEPACHPGLLRPPRPDMTDAEVFEDMYHGLKCLQKAVVDPWAVSGAVERQRQLRRRASSSTEQQGAPHHSGGFSQHFRCWGQEGAADMGPPLRSNVSREEAAEEAWEIGWRAVAERQLCAVADAMYEAMIVCRHGLRRGMHIHSSGELLIRLSAERRCPAGLAVCAVVKNEAAYIQEWLVFHLHSGVQHFYLYLNDDEEDTLTALQPFINAGFVTIETIDGGGVQGEAYDRCLRRVKEGRLAEWLAFFDVDEYLFLGDHGCLMDYLQQLDDRAALTVNWRTYSPSNQVLPVPPDRLLIESNVYTRADEAALGLDIHVKSIVRVNRTAVCRHPHVCSYAEGWAAKDEWGQGVDGPFNPHFPPGRYVHMHHYQMRSQADFLMKRLRGRAGVANYSWDFPSISHYVGVTARMASVLGDIKPGVGAVRRVLGLE